MVASTTMTASLGTFGRSVERSDLAEHVQPPVPFDITGYLRRVVNEHTLKDGQLDPDWDMSEAEQIFTFHIRPIMEFGPIFDLLLCTDIDGKVKIESGVKFVANCLVEGEADKFTRTINDPSLIFLAGPLAEVAEAIVEYYGYRPSLSRSERRPGPRRTGRTTEAARSSKRAPASRTSL